MRTRVAFGGTALLVLGAMLLSPYSYARAASPPPGTAIVNTALVRYRDANGNVFPAATGSVETPLAAAAVLAVEKTASSDPAAMGSVLTYTLAYRNTGNAPAANVVLTDTLSGYVVFQSASGGGVHAPGPPGGGTVTWNLGTIPAGGSGAVTVVVRVKTAADYAPGDPAAIHDGASIANSFSLSSPDGAASGAIATAVGTGTNVVLSKAQTPAVVGPGGTIAYTLDYANLGNAPAANVVITDELPVGTAYVSGSATGGGVLSGRTLTWTVGPLAAGASGSVSFSVHVSTIAADGAVVSNTAGLVHAGGVLSSNTVSARVAAEGLLSVAKTAAASEIVAGTAVSYTIVVRNDGSLQLTGVTVRDPLPANTEFVSADGGGILVGGDVVWTIGILAAGESRTLRLTVRAAAGLPTGAAIANAATGTSGESPAAAGSVVLPVRGRTPGTIEFLDKDGNPTGYYDAEEIAGGGSFYLRVADADQNVDSTRTETVLVTVTDPATGKTVTAILTETGPDTGVFTGSFTEPAWGLADTRLDAVYTDPVDGTTAPLAVALVDPYGIVFDSITGAPVAGATVILCYGGTSTPVAPGDLPPGQPNTVVTDALGAFAFPFLPPGTYRFVVLPPAGVPYGYPSAVAPGDLPPGFVIATGSYGEDFTLVAGQPPLNLDIPVDPAGGALQITKTASRTSASVGDIIRYTIVVTNAGTGPVVGAAVADRLPHGFQYVAGSTQGAGTVVAEPAAQSDRTLVWTLGTIPAGTAVTFSYAAVAGAESERGDGRNTATATGTTGGQAAAPATASCTVRISAGVFTTKGTVLGKVFVDADGNRRQNAGEPGVAGATLFLEDGTRVVADRNGKFSIPGVKPGTHVLRLDETTLPPGLRAVPLANRFLGSASSQVVDMVPHGIFAADFAVERIPGADAGAAAPADETEIFTVQAATYRPSDEEKAVAAAKVLESKGVRDVRVERLGDMLALRAGALATAPEAESVRRDVRAAFPGAFVRGAYVKPERVVYPAAAAEPAASSPWEERIRTMTPEAAILSPADGSVAARRTVNVVVKAPLEASAGLLVNGAPVPPERIGRRIEHTTGKVALVEYVGVELRPGEANVLRLEVKDPFGNVRGSSQITVKAVGAPAVLEAVFDRTSVPADGRATAYLRLSVADRNGERVADPRMATVEISAGEILGEDAAPSEAGFQVAMDDGRAVVRIRAPFEPGEGRLTAAVDDLKTTAVAVWTPNLRAPLLVGIGEAVVGRGRTRGSLDHLRHDSWLDEGLYAGARGAFFFKGAVGAGTLLTAGYDSRKQTAADFFNRSADDPENSEFYPIYGDDSSMGHETPSREKLYIRFDRGTSYLMYGDIQTNFTETVLGAYTRTLTGIKTEIKTAKADVAAFVSRTDQAQVVDTLPGRGVSGYYYLTRRPVIEGSERIVIETRDRRRMELVLTRETRSRGVDYTIDYEAGAVLFKAPVPSLDADLNPVYIIVTYETTGGDRQYVYGARAVFRPFGWADLGTTAVVEENPVSDYRLLAADATVRLPGKTTLRAELAETDSLMDIGGVLSPAKGRGRLLEIESRPLDRLSVKAGYRDVGINFGNLSAVDAMRGMERYSGDVSYRFSETLRLTGRYLHENDTLNDMRHELGSVGVEKKRGKSSLLLEAYHETASDKYVAPTDPGSRYPFDIARDIPEESTALRLRLSHAVTGDLTVHLEHRQNLLSADDTVSQAGIEYRVDANRKLYLRQEYGQYAGRNETRTALGIESKLFRDTVAFNEYRLSDGVDGERNRQAIGLRNTFLLWPGATGNFSVENLSTLSGSERPDNPDSFAAALGLEYLPRENVKLTGRLEHRHETDDNAQLAEIGAAWKLSPSYALLARHRVSMDDPLVGRRLTARSLIGLAYRPVANNRFNALARLEYREDLDSTTAPGSDADAAIFSLEGVWRLDTKTQFTAKYAGKLASDYGFDSYTDLIAARLMRDLTDRLDFGVEGRILRSQATGAYSLGGSVEIGWRAVRNLWISVGYSLDKFDSDLVGDSYWGRGPYLKFRFKFDETLLRPREKQSTGDTRAPEHQPE